MEGDALLARAMATPGAPVQLGSGLLNSTGEQMKSETPAAPKPPTPEEVAKHEAGLQAQKKIHDDHVASVMKRLQELIAKDSELTDLMSLVLLSHRIIAFAKMEMAFRPGMSDELIDYTERAQHAKANDPRGFDTRDLEKGIKGQLLPILRALTKKYELLANLRITKLKKAQAKLPSGFNLPVPFAKKFAKPFHIGNMMIVTGPEVAVQAAMNFLTGVVAAHGVESYRLHSKLSGNDEKLSQTVMPATWWRGGADDLSKLEELLRPVFDSIAPIAFVDEVIQLISPTGAVTPLERKAGAIRALKQWSTENMCALIAGDVIDDDVPDTRVYGNIPYFKVRVEEKDGKRVLLVDEQPIELE